MLNPNNPKGKFDQISTSYDYPEEFEEDQRITSNYPTNTIKNKIYPNPPPEIQEINIRDPPPPSIAIGIPLHNNSKNLNSTTPYPGYQINYPYQNEGNNIIIDEEENNNSNNKKKMFMKPDLTPMETNFEESRTTVKEEKENKTDGAYQNKGRKQYNYYSGGDQNAHVYSGGGAYLDQNNQADALCYCCLNCRCPRCRIYFCVDCCRACCKGGGGGRRCNSSCADVCKCCCDFCDSGCVSLLLACCKLFLVICKGCLECLAAILGS